MKVWVVCQNDFPFAVFSSREAAEAFCDHQPKDMHGRPIYWHTHEFEVQQ